MTDHDPESRVPRARLSRRADRNPARLAPFMGPLLLLGLAIVILLVFVLLR
ncbi:hypothetical protein [Ornithinimicrobium tianjinense]|uniref:Uncharacterized protein n=1 Tax=Ornithinimicrobium tianjinense TaxID=1195761 RepID=A0A917BL76_9MICO|nr:hypothetical protein [Ornithinimicrobium tianjinense]GGF46607.1 hypothetical protein GCM10011366_12890 [Ornithinimicrobium tianjinense]